MENVWKRYKRKCAESDAWFWGFAQIEKKKESLTLSPMEKMVREYESEEKWAESNAYIYYLQATHSQLHGSGDQSSQVWKGEYQWLPQMELWLHKKNLLKKSLQMMRRLCWCTETDGSYSRNCKGDQRCWHTCSRRVWGDWSSRDVGWPSENTSSSDTCRYTDKLLQPYSTYEIVMKFYLASSYRTSKI